MKKKKQIKILSIIIAIILCCFFSTIAYSAMYSTMEISGVAYARPIKDVRITDFKLNSSGGGATVSYDEFGANHLATKINLIDSTSYAIFDVEVTNYGNVDVGIHTLNDNSGSPVITTFIDYNYDDKLCDDTGKCNNMAVKKFQIKITGIPGEYELNYDVDFRTYHKVTYTGITNNNNYPTEIIDGGKLDITFTENLKRVSVLQDGSEVAYYPSITSNQSIEIPNITGDIEIKTNPPVARLVSGNLNTVGSEVCIKDECFYIISNDGSTVTMLAKYNLHVGNTYDDTNGAVAIENPTGIQNEKAIGWFEGYTVDNPIVGSKPFSLTNYWSSTVSSYPAYVYNENSNVYVDVENYKSYLETLRVNLQAARLIKLEELEKLGCSRTTGTCIAAPAWVYSTTYWTGEAGESTDFWRIYTNGALGGSNYSLESRGVRPVIEISVDEIRNPYEVGAENCFDNECFYTISSDATTVTMLAKYNLYVGGYMESNWTAYGTEATGKQDSTMIGGTTQKPYYGVVEFSTSSNSYSTSKVKTYIDNYSQILSSMGIPPTSARLITLAELENLGCSSDNLTCSGAPSWVYSTSYWTGVTSSSDWVKFVSSRTGAFQNYWYGNMYEAGVRPVITLKKIYFKNKINLTIDGTTYQAYEGMTWKEWIDSNFNTSGIYYTNTNYIYNSNGKSIIGNNNCVLSTDVISSSNSYTILNSGYSCE